jgi:Cu-Zn family superoxide dismutase
MVKQNRCKNEFLGVLSHELRNPLTPIRNSPYILDRATPGGEQARRRTVLIIEDNRHAADSLSVAMSSRGWSSQDLGNLFQPAALTHPTSAMKKTILLFVLFSLVSARGMAKGGGITVGVKDATGKDVGTVNIKPIASGVKLKLNLRGLTSGEHAIHFHQNAKCEAPDFKSAGPHFNPDGKMHGLENPMGAHAGDMLNFTADEKGNAKATIVNKSVNLGTDAHSLYSNGGTSLVVHAKADDMKTDPAGNAGDRIACGLIVK